MSFILLNATTNNATTAVVFINNEVLPKGLAYVVTAVFALLSAIGLFGNGLIFYLFASRKVSRTPFNLLLLNLSISDALACVMIWPYIVIDLKQLRGMRQGIADALCVLTMGQTPYWMATVASTFTLFVISLSRYMVVRHPLKARYFNNKHVSFIIICAVWPTAMSFTIPNCLSFVYNAKYAVCQRVWPKNFNGQVFSAVSAVFGFVIPVAMMTYTFVATRRRFWQINATGIYGTNVAMQQRRKAAMLLGALCLAFFVCWIPYFVYWILSRTVTSYFKPGPEGEIQRMPVLRCVMLFALCNTIADPIIYGMRGDEFKDNLQKIAGRITCFAKRIKTLDESDMKSL